MPRTAADDAAHRDAVLQLQLGCGLLQSPGCIVVDDHLCYSVAVAQIDEMQRTVVPVSVDPSVQDDGPALVGGAQLAAGDGPLEESFFRHLLSPGFLM